MKHIYLKTLLASSVLLAVGCTSTATLTPAQQLAQDQSTAQGFTGESVLTPVAVSASSHDGNGPDRLIDNDIKTRWSANGDGEWAMLDYGSAHEFNAVRAAFSKGNERQSKFDILVSTDGKTWTPVLENQMSSGGVIGLERFAFPPVTARYIKYVGHGNTDNGWSSVTELAALNCGVNACPTNQIITPEVVAAEQDMIAQMKADAKAQKIARQDLRKGNFGAAAVYPCLTTVKCGSGELPTPTGLPATPKAGNAPSQNFDLTTWYLSQPFDHDKNNRPDDVNEWDLANGYSHPDVFYTAADGGLVFKTFVKGVRTSPNTKYARTELREMLRKGDKSIPTKGVNKNNWVFSSAPVADQKAAGGVDGVLNATLKIDHATTTGEAGQVGRFIIGQIHDQDDEPIRLYYRKLPNQPTGTVYFAHENTLKGTDTFYDLVGGMTGEIGDKGIALGEKFSYQIAVKGNTMTVTVMRPGKPDVKQVVDMSESGYDVGGKYMYFKAGVYNQNISGDLDDYAQATFYKLDKSHSTYTGK
ncbi:alginate lyase [Vibrio sp. S11_S32]|uniref:polysaccharide lyase family 7 protein n=1 Tax=Vibrio sp. S11_S32 TaxID=2720225 RepID=UPI0016801766|nr:polysaccharide lyase family 7 protein [Vibrio sp. S11_S32]MBD1574880.1 alginate lyase [Vibrio sp. S11_S32]